MALNLEKSIPFTREKKLKTQPIFVIISLLNAVSVPVLYTSCMGKRVTACIPLHLLQHVNSMNSIQYFGNRSVEKKKSLAIVMGVTEICHSLKIVVSCVQNAKMTCLIFQSRMLILLQSLDIEPVHSVMYCLCTKQVWKRPDGKLRLKKQHEHHVVFSHYLKARVNFTAIQRYQQQLLQIIMMQTVIIIVAFLFSDARKILAYLN